MSQESLILCLFAALAIAPYSCAGPLPDAGKSKSPEILEVSATDISSSAATFIATVSDGSHVASGGFSLTEQGGNEAHEIQAAIDGDRIFASASGLQPGSEYSLSAFISNGAGQRSTSSQVSFTTPAIPDIPENPSVKDESFLAWLLWNFDSDSDGILSSDEGAQISTIELNTDNISTLADLSFFPGLQKIHAEGTRRGDSGLGKLTGIDASANSNLQIIYATHNHICSLKLPDVKTKLCNIAFCINELQAVDIREYKELDFVDIAYNRLESIDLVGLDKLDELHLDNNPLKDVTLDNKLLRYIDVHGTLVSVLDFSRCPKLNVADCSNCPELKTIYLAKGQVIGTLRTDPGVTIIYYD